VSKNRYELLDEALLFEIGATRRLYKALRDGHGAERAHGDFDAALERWVVLRADLDADVHAPAGAGKFTTDFMAGIDESLFGPRAIWSLRASVCWALGTRSSALTVPRDEFPIETEGDLVVQALLEMVNPWEASAVLTAVETRVGEALNTFLLRPGRHTGLENLAEIVLMAREAGARKVYFASAAPPVRFPNVYGIDMPAANELIAHGRDEDAVCTAIAADRLIYQDLEDLIAAVQRGNRNIDKFDCSVFTGEYVTGLAAGYLDYLASLRADGSLSEPMSGEVLDLANKK